MYSNNGASALVLAQKVAFVKNMKKANHEDEQKWNIRARLSGGADLTMLQWGAGLSDEEFEDCWTKHLAMIGVDSKGKPDPSELYHLHADLVGHADFKLPPIDPGGGNG